MRSVRPLCAVGALGLAAWAAQYTADQLIARIMDAQKTSGFRTRARLIRTSAGTGAEEVTQLLIKGRREGEAAEVLYQALWPPAVRGQALVVQRRPGHAAGGFFYEPPDSRRPLTAELLARPFFGSDLSVEDLVEEFWSWPSQRVAGREALEGRACYILESRPPAGAATAYSLVKSWIAPDLALPVRIEKYFRDGRVAKRFTAERLLKQAGGRWAAARVVVSPAGGHSRTVLEGTKSERDLLLPAEQFTLEGLKNSLAAATP